jgi:hypothetical protein
MDIEPYQHYRTLYSNCSPSGWTHPPSDRSPTGSKPPLPHCFFIQHNHYYCRGPLPCTSDTNNTDTCFHPQSVVVFRKLGTRLNLGGLTALTSASTLSFPPYLRCLSSTSMMAQLVVDEVLFGCVICWGPLSTRNDPINSSNGIIVSI